MAARRGARVAASQTNIHTWSHFLGGKPMSPCPENAHSEAARAIARARRALGQGKLDKAERLCAEIVRHRPHDVDALHLLGMLHYQRGQLAEALALLRMAVAIDDRRADMWSDLGLILLAFARFDEALAAYDRACGI